MTGEHLCKRALAGAIRPGDGVHLHRAAPLRLSWRTISWSAIATCRFSTISAFIIGKQKGITDFAFFANVDSEKVVLPEPNRLFLPLRPDLRPNSRANLHSFFSQLRHKKKRHSVCSKKNRMKMSANQEDAVWPTVEPSAPAHELGNRGRIADSAAGLAR